MKKNEYLYENIRTECWNNALHSYGTSYIFSKRASFKNKKLKALTFLGIIVPVTVGGIVTTYDSIDKSTLNWIFLIAGSSSLLQLILSVLSLVYKWDDSYLYYLESSIDNSLISKEFENLFKKYNPEYTEVNLRELQDEKNKTDLKYSIRLSNDSKFPFTERENREGMRYALRYFKRKCEGCGLVPKDMNPANCGVCGNF